MKLLAAFLLILVGCVAPPSQANPNVYGTVHVAFDQSLDGVTDWRSDQQQYMNQALSNLNALGPAFARVDPGDANVDLVVRTFDSGPGCTNGAGRYTHGLHYVEVDPACCAGYLELQEAINHEVMHWVTDSKWGWLGHICTDVSEQTPENACHPTIFGSSVINPSLVGPDMGPSFDEAWGGGATLEGVPTQVDLDLIARCARTGSCL